MLVTLAFPAELAAFALVLVFDVEVTPVAVDCSCVFVLTLLAIASAKINLTCMQKQIIDLILTAN